MLPLSPVPDSGRSVQCDQVLAFLTSMTGRLIPQQANPDRTGHA